MPGCLAASMLCSSCTQLTISSPRSPSSVRPAAVLPGATASARVPMTQVPAMQAPEQQQLLQVALKCNQLGVMYLNDNIPAQLLAPQPQQQQPLAFF